MKNLFLGSLADSGKPFALPIEIMNLASAVLAMRGAGKTHTSSVYAEELLEAKQQVIVFDPTGAWWGLKSSKDGKKEGFPVVVFGGRHADIPLQPGAARVLVQAIVEKRFSAIIDVSMMRKTQMRTFAAEFFEALYEMNTQAMHLFIDEADTVCPQQVLGDVARLVGAVDDVVKRGRIKGIGCTLITQRSSSINKNVLSQCEMLIAMRMSHPRDIEPVEEWIRVHADAKAAADAMASLPSLPRGVGWFWAPSLDLFAKIKVRDRGTFDSSATPKPGVVVKAPRKLAKVDAEKLGAAITAMAEEAKASAPTALRAKIAELEGKLAKAATPATAAPAAAKPAKAKPQVDVQATVEAAVTAAVAARDKQWQEVLDKANLRIAFAAEKLTKAEAPPPSTVGKFKTLMQTSTTFDPPHPSVVVTEIKQKPADTPVQRQPVINTNRLPAAVTGTGSGTVTSPGQRKVLIALTQREGLTRRQIAVRAGYSQNSGTFSATLTALRNAGHIDGGGNGLIRITDAGVAALGEFEPLPTGRDLVEYWIRELGQSGEARILQALVDVYPQRLSREQLGAAVSMSTNSGTFSGYLTHLSDLELIDRNREGAKANDEFFQ